MEDTATFNTLATKIVMKQLGFDTKHFILPDTPNVQLVMTSDNYSVFVNLSNGGGVTICMKKEQFDEGLRSLTTLIKDHNGQ